MITHPLLQLFCIFAFLLPHSVAVAEDSTVRHELSFPRGLNQYVHVNLQLPVAGGLVILAMPNWTPGSYQIADFAAHVEGLQAQDSDGRFLDVRKLTKNRWQIDSGDAQLIMVNYDVWAGELNVSTNWVDSEYALLNGAGVFLYSEASRKLPQQVVVRLPPGWSQVHTALESLPGVRTFIAVDFDELVDSPILAGNAVKQEFEVSGQAYRLVNEGDTGFWDEAQAVKDTGVIVETIQDFWQINPFERPYWFINILSVGNAGLEHDHSTVMLTGPWQMRDRGEYIKWLGLLSHEFFHAWNVRRMRPQALAVYDYDREVYSRELWLAEGLTSYYDNLLLFRSGLITVVEFFELMAVEFQLLETVPGRLVRSAELASFDAWIKHYRKDANSVNSTISYYRKGAVIGFITDMAIRRASGDEASLDDVMRAMYAKYGPGGTTPGGYPPGAFEDMVEQFAGVEVREQIHSLITTTADSDLNDALDWFGLVLDRHPAKVTATGVAIPARAGLGVTWEKESSLLVVAWVVHGGSAAVAGVLPGDELLAINGSRVMKNNISDRLLKLVPGERVALLLSRHERVFELPAVVGEAISDTFLIKAKARISSREKKRLEKWLGRELTFSKN